MNRQNTEVGQDRREQEGAVGGAIQLQANEDEVVALTGQPVQPNGVARKKTTSEKSTQDETLNVTDDSIFRDLQTKMAKKTREQELILLQLQCMKALRDEAAKRDQLRAQAEQLAAELEQEPKYDIIHDHAKSVSESRTKFKEWLNKADVDRDNHIKLAESIRAISPIHIAISEPGVRVRQSEFLQDKQALLHEKQVANNSQRQAGHQKGHQVQSQGQAQVQYRQQGANIEDMVTMGLQEQTTIHNRCGNPTIQQINKTNAQLLSSQQYKVKAPKYSVIEKLGGIDRPFDDYFRNADMHNMRECGLWLADGQNQIPVHPSENLGIPEQVVNNNQPEEPDG